MGYPRREFTVIESVKGWAEQRDGFLHQLTATTQQAFERIKLSVIYPKGAILYGEGQPPRGIYLLCRGRVKLSVCTSEGKGLILQLVDAGEILGLPANIANQPYEVTAEALEPCQVDFVEREAFLQFLQEHNDACFRATERLGKKYLATYDQVRSLGLSHSALERLARLILNWCDHQVNGFRLGPDVEIRIKVNLTHEEIARMIGTSRETVSRLFSELRERRTITRKGATLIVRDRPALARLVAN